LLKQVLGVEAVLASRSLSSSLRRTSVLVGAFSTAIAMMTAVGIMVGSFRETVLLWMGDQLPADLYLRPAGTVAADRHPTISMELTDEIVRLPGVAAIDRLREYEISYEGMPAGLGSVELNILRSYHNADFLSGRKTSDVLAELRGSDAVLVSEPFANKHHLRAGDSITLSLGESRASFRVADVYYDYSSERGSILMDRNVMLRYLPDPAASNLAIYVAPDARIEDVRAEIARAAAGHSVLMFTNRDLRGEALRIFDRTFAITYALEAIAVLIAVMGVAGALLALVIDRRRELGLLRFLGAASGQIRKLIVIEAGLIGLLANFAGIALGFTLSLILIFVINKQSFGWTIRFHWPVAVLLGALTVVYAATVLAGLYPARVAVRLNPVEVVHEE
jgi:putative ABC transport system permease protein